MTGPKISASGWALLFLLLAALLRFYRLDDQSFWNDEGNSARLAERSPRLIIEGAGGDIHPPGYYLALAGWRRLAGESEFALRAFSAFAGIALVALVGRLGRAYYDRRAAAWAALFAALHPGLVYYSQEARMYALAAALGAACFLLAGRYAASGERRHAVGYVLTAAAGLYTHYSFAFVLFAVNLAALGAPIADRAPGPRRRWLARWLGLQLGALLLFAPWLPTALRQVTSWPAVREPVSFVEAFFGSVAWTLLGGTADRAAWLAGLVGLAGLFVAANWRRAHSMAVLVWLFAPVGLMAGLGLYTESFAKFLIVAAPAMCLLLGNHVGGRVAPDLTSAQRRGVALLALSFGGLTGLAMWSSLRNLYFDPAYARDDYRAIARYVQADARPGDAVILNAPNQWEVFTYYHRSGAPVYPLPRTRPLDPRGTAAELEQIAALHDRLYVLWWGEAQADPARFVEDWLNTHAFKAVDTWYGSVRLSIYAASTATATVTPLGARFGEAIALEGYSLISSGLAPGDILQLTLFWRAEVTPAARYKVFVHITAAPDAPPLAQQDGEPGGGLRLTTTWLPGEQIADNHGVLLPPDMPPGEYQLAVGMYNVLDGERLPITLGGQSMGDRLLLETIVVR